MVIFIYGLMWGRRSVP